MRHYGTRCVRLQMAGAAGTGVAQFEVTDVKRPILSAGRMADSGHTLVLNAQDPHLLRPTGERVLLEMHGGLPFVRATVVGSTRIPGVHWIAPVEAPMPQAPLAGEAPAEPLLAMPRAQALQKDDVQAGVVAKGLRGPVVPTPAEVAEHELTHLPAKPWCEHCIRGRGRDAVHKATTERIDEVIPVIEMDYFYITGAAGDGEKNSQTAIAAVCRSTGYLFASAVEEKGPKCAYAVAAMVSWLKELGYAKCVLQSDGEPSLVAYRDAVRERYLKDAAPGAVELVTCRVSPVGSHESNGGAERAVQTLRGLARVYLDSMQSKTGCEGLPAASPWWSWALRHAAWTYNRFHVRHDTRCTPYTKLRWRVYQQPLVTFGELVLARRPGAHLQKAESWFVYGAWVGRDSRNDEHIILTKAGVLRSRAVRRLTPDRCWSSDLVTHMEWTPWRTAAVMRGRPPKETGGEPLVSAPMPTADAAYGLLPNAPRPAASSASAAPSAAFQAGEAEGAGAQAQQPAAAAAGSADQQGGGMLVDDLVLRDSMAASSSSGQDRAGPPAGAAQAPPSPKQSRDLESEEQNPAKHARVSVLPESVRAWLALPLPNSELAISAPQALGGTLRQRSATPPMGEAETSSPASPKKARGASDMDITVINMVSNVCEAERIEAEELLSSTSEGALRQETARAKHLETLKQHEVYESHPLPMGVKPMSCRWVDRDDGIKAKSRLTARGYEQRLTGEETFYAGTPLASTLRLLLVMAKMRGYSVSVGDCQDAFLQAPIQEASEVWVWPPPEARETEGHAWLLRKTLPGLKGGPAAWGDHATEITTKEFGLTPSRVDPCLSSDVKKEVWCMRHMDDYLMVGPRSSLQALHEGMEKKMKLRDIAYLDNPGDSVQFLGWILTRTTLGFDVLVNSELAKEIVDDAGLRGSTRSSAVPGTRDRVENDTPATDLEHRYYRTQVGRLLFYSVLRPDLQFATTQLSKHVHAPKASHMVMLKRAIRYLATTSHWVLHLVPTGRRPRIETQTDSDWAGSEDRRSTSGGVVMVAGACVLSYSRTQASRALSSCEAELYAMGSGAVESLQLHALMCEQGFLQRDEIPLLRTDSSSALTLAGRRGQGRLKHVECRLLALQDWTLEKRISLGRVSTDMNDSDALTKFLSKNAMNAIMTRLGVGEPGVSS